MFMLIDLPSRDVTIFDNLNTFISQAVYVIKNVGHCLAAIPDLIGDSVVSVSEFLEFCPPFISFIILFTLGTGIILKGAHWRS